VQNECAERIVKYKMSVNPTLKRILEDEENVYSAEIKVNVLVLLKHLCLFDSQYAKDLDFGNMLVAFSNGKEDLSTAVGQLALAAKDLIACLS
jgi:hypothetical protein